VNWSSVVWIVLFCLCVGFEVFTVVNKAEGDTLSENVWRLRAWLKRSGRAGQVGWVAFVWGLIGFFGWLVIHFVFPGSV